MPSRRSQSSAAAIALIVTGMFGISVNDMLIKFLSGGYPLHQMVFVRSLIGIGFMLVLLHWEGGWRLLRTDRFGLHMLRGLLIVGANGTFFTALAVMPLADATAIFFVSPLMITLLSIPILGERVGPRRLSAVLVGFLGVLVMVRPGGSMGDYPVWVLCLPVVAAFGYACTQVLTRLLGGAMKASALAVYIQGMFLLVAGVFYLVAGDGRFAAGVQNDGLLFLLRPWVWPEGADVLRFLVLGLISALVGYCLSQAYRLGDAATVAPFEYSSMPLAVFWGWLVFGTLPGVGTWVGMAMILAAGLYVLWRERLTR